MQRRVRARPLPRAAVGVFALALLATVAAPRAGRADVAIPPCAPLVDVPGIGPSCPVPGGWQVWLGDGTTVVTPGVDVVPPRASTAGDPQPVNPSCATDPRTQFHNVLIYAHGSDSPNVYGGMQVELRDMAKLANGIVHRDAVQDGRAVDLRFLCANGLLVVNDAPIALRTQDMNLDTLVTGLRALGFTSPMAKYWVWFEGQPPGAGGGAATIEYDDRNVAENRNNFGPSYGVTWGIHLADGGARMMLHQAAHMLGAVQLTAPHTTGAGHCTDGLDVMCERDGGETAGRYAETACSTLRFDCGGDDYFNPVPSGWLASHWNIASPIDRYVAGCMYASGLLAAGAGTGENEGIFSKSHVVPDSCRGRPYALTAATPQPLGVEPLTSAQLAALPVPDVNVCFYNGVSKIRCDQAAGTDRGTIPSSATSAHVVLNYGAAATYVLSAI